MQDGEKEEKIDLLTSKLVHKLNAFQWSQKFRGLIDCGNLE